MDFFTSTIEELNAVKLNELTDKELGTFQRSLGRHVNTDDHSKAKHLNSMVYSEKDRRDNYGW